MLVYRRAPVKVIGRYVVSVVLKVGAQMSRSREPRRTEHAMFRTQRRWENGGAVP